MTDSFYTDRLEDLVRELLAIDERRMQVVLNCGNDIERGIKLTEPIMRDHKRVLADLVRRTRCT
jgi:hypothetical protein